MTAPIESRVPASRVRILNDAPLREGGDFVLYWMNAYRRTRDNFALDRAVEWARALNKPLVVLEALRSGYPWASDRLHRFVIQGMRDNALAFEESPVTYYPYIEPRDGRGKGLMSALGERAAVIVTDYFPAFFLPRAVAAGARAVSVRFEQIDSVGIMPVGLAQEAFKTAYAFRRFLQRELPAHLGQAPRPRPLSRLELRRLPATYFSRRTEIEGKWPCAKRSTLDASSELLSTLPIDHGVAPSTLEGGPRAGEKRLKAFLALRLQHYGKARAHPDEEGTSGLSAYLHFGHVSSHRILRGVLEHEGWTPERLSLTASGGKSGWWGVGADAEAFLDQLITWREVGFNFCANRADYDRYESLPDWSRATLDAHAEDDRPELYSLEQLEEARTRDELWNAAERQLVKEGRMHNSMRMLWGKKILQWTRSPREALHVLIELNNKYAVDGRDPSSYSGIFWILGRYDRPWAPERPIFGVIRYMSSESARKKLHLRSYLEKYGPD